MSAVFEERESTVWKVFGDKVANGSRTKYRKK